MATTKVLSADQLTEIGRRHGSTDIEKESSEAKARWQRDLPVLRSFGAGQAAFDRFSALCVEHAASLQKRPEAVAFKASTVAERNGATKAAWLWVDQVEGVLGTLAESDATFANELAEATPDNDAELSTHIPAMKALIERRKADLPQDADLDKRSAEADAIAQALTDAPGRVATAKAAPVADTTEIDLIDGKLYVAMRALNNAGKKAVRHGKLAARLDEYTFQHLNQRARAPKPAEPVS